MLVTFLTDFGLQDDFVGTCHGVIKRIAPETEIIDVTHGIPAQQVLQGALVLANTLPYLPVGVHLAVVDPGVGSSRRALALRDGEGRLYVGPDNGLLLPAAERAGIDAAHELANPRHALETISRTFHGRDLFAPAAAHLSLGVAIEEPARRSPSTSSSASTCRSPTSLRRGSVATVLYVDNFGNVALNLTREHVNEVGVVRAHRRARPRRRAFLCGRGAHVRRRAGGRHHALRGQLREDVDRDQRRQRGRHVARSRGPVDQDPRRNSPIGLSCE